MAEETVVQVEDRVGSGRINFIFFIFTPIILSYFIPIICYQWPLRFRVNGQVLEFDYVDILHALLVCFMWFVLTIGIIVWPGKNLERYNKKRIWFPKIQRNVFVIFSLLGSVIALFSFFYVMPATLETFTHLIAFMPTIAFILGQSIIRDKNITFEYCLNNIGLFTLLFIDLVVIITPIILGFVGPTIFSVIAILYGINALKLPLLRKCIIGIVLVGIVMFALPFKHYLRELLYNGMLERVAVEELSNKSARKMFPEIKIQHKQRFSDELKEFSVFEPNYCRLQIINSKDCKGIPRYVINRILNRINHIGELIYVMKLHPKEIPYNKLETYRPIFTKFIPRILWKNKPKENMGQYFGHKYGFLNKDDFKTTIVLPIIVEGWMSYGWLGVILSAIFMGMLLRVIWFVFLGDSDASGNIMLGLVVVMTAVVQETNLSFVFGEIVIVLIFYLLIDEMVRYKRKAPILF